MQCTATKRNGQQCSSQAIKGGNVCRMHGGGAPQVKEAARLRLLALVNPALAVLAKSLKAHKKQPQVALSAAKDVLDRAGFKSADELQVSGPGGAPLQVNVSLNLVPSPAPIDDDRTT